MFDYIEVPEAQAAVTANTTSVGVITVADTSIFFAGAEAHIRNTDANSGQRIQITRILTSTTMQAKVLPNTNQPADVTTLNYLVGGDLSAFTLAKGSTVFMPKQVVRVALAFTKQNML